MGEQAPGSITVYTCPDQKTANAILDLIQGHSLSEDWGGGYDGTFRLDTLYGDDSMSMGNDFDLAAALGELGVIFKVQQDGKYEIPGMVFYGHPDLGTFEQTGDNDGQVTINADTIDKILTDAPDEAALRAALGQLTGKAWRDAVAAAQKDDTRTLEWTFVELDEDDDPAEASTT